MSFDLTCSLRRKNNEFSNKLLQFEGLTSKNGTICTNIQINKPKLVYTWECDLATTKKVFSYTGSP